MPWDVEGQVPENCRTLTPYALRMKPEARRPDREARWQVGPEDSERAGRAAFLSGGGRHDDLGGLAGLQANPTPETLPPPSPSKPETRNGGCDDGPPGES